MKLAFVADVHVANHQRFGGAMENGLNRRGREIVATLGAASKAAKAEGCEGFVVLGDLFDHTRPTPQLVSAVAAALLAGGLPVVIILGNHDLQSDGRDDHACASLGWINGIDIIDRPEVYRGKGNLGDFDLLCVPYAPGLASEWLPAGLAKILPTISGIDRKRVLATHLGIWDDATPPYMKAAKDAVGVGQVRWLMDAHGIDLTIAGNWHSAEHWVKPQIVIPGALCPNGFHDIDWRLTGAMIVYDTNGNSTRKVRIPGPRWITCDGMSPFAANTQTTDASHLYIRARVRAEDMAQALELRDSLEASGTASVSVELAQVPRAAMSTAAREAVAAAGGQLDAAFFTEVEAPGTREGVARRLAEYRKASQ